MLTTLFAQRSTWIGALIVVAAAYVVWFLFRAFLDFVHWFHEEIIEDYREGKRKKDEDSERRPRRRRNAESHTPEQTDEPHQPT